MKYKIIVNRYSADLEIDVQRSIKKGWEPQGGIAVEVVLLSMSEGKHSGSYESQTETWFYQAMVKK